MYHYNDRMFNRTGLTARGTAGRLENVPCRGQRSGWRLVLVFTVVHMQVDVKPVEMIIGRLAA